MSSNAHLDAQTSSAQPQTWDSEASPGSPLRGLRTTDVIAVLLIGGIAFGCTVISHSYLGIVLELAGAAGGVMFAALVLAYAIMRRLRGLGRRTGTLEEKATDLTNRSDAIEQRVTKLEIGQTTAPEPSATTVQPRQGFGLRAQSPAQAPAQSPAQRQQPQRTPQAGRAAEPQPQPEATADPIEQPQSTTASKPFVRSSPTLDAIRAVAELNTTDTALVAPTAAVVEEEPAPQPQLEADIEAQSKTLMAEALAAATSHQGPKKPLERAQDLLAAATEAAEMPSELTDNPSALNSAGMKSEAEIRVLAAVHRAIETKHVDLYLQPVLAMQDRKVEYYEVLSRISDADGQVIPAADFVPIASEADLISRLDHLMLLKAIQVARRLKERGTHRTLFCNLSVKSLADPGFFSAFLRYLSDNRVLNESLMFEFSQDQLAQCEDLHWTGMKALADIGYCFSLDGVHDLSLDLEELRERNFQVIKVGAKALIEAFGGSASPEMAQHLLTSLASIDMKLVVEKIEDEADLRILSESGINLGQGRLFAEPRPVRPDVFEPVSEASKVA